MSSGKSLEKTLDKTLDKTLEPVETLLSVSKSWEPQGHMLMRVLWNVRALRILVVPICFAQVC